MRLTSHLLESRFAPVHEMHLIPRNTYRIPTGDTDMFAEQMFQQDTQELGGALDGKP